MLRKFLLASVFAVTSAFAQSSHGYVTGGVAGVWNGGSTAAAYTAFGGDVLVRHRVGVNFDLAAVTKGYNALGIVSLNGSYHGRPMNNGKIGLYLTGGYSAIGSGGDFANGFNVGGGVHYWFARNLGWKTEVRNHYWPSWELGTTIVSTGIAIRPAPKGSSD